jgi:hypothetical protein
VGRVLAALSLSYACLVVEVGAQSSSGQGLGPDGAPAETITDFAAVQRTKRYRAVRASDPIEIDGRIDETAWSAAQVGRGFHQTDPVSGAPATEDTEFRILYDEDQIYVGVTARQRGPIIISELKREFAATDGDVIVLFFDTFDDDRNGFAFMTNAGSAMRDLQIAGGVPNENWDGIYEVASAVHDWGWSAEFAIPFKTLRFSENPTQTWGFNIQRITRSSNEWVQWSPAPRPFRIFEASVAGTLEGIEGVSQGRNLKVKPFLVANAQGDNAATQRKTVDGGLDAKLGITSELTLDLTVNTDFSHVEADEQQVNLTRFGLFFPEKREFFLENLGLFDICGNAAGGGRGGRGGGRGGGGGGGGGNARCDSEREAVPFFSRRIGLSEGGQPLPIRGGARLTGKAAGLDVGMLFMRVADEQDEGPSNNWMVGRVRRDVLSNSQIGGFVFNRDATVADDWNRVFGADASFVFLEQRLSLSGFAMRSEIPTAADGSYAGSVQVNYQDRLVQATSGFVGIDAEFNNDFGFVPRSGIRKYFNMLGFTPRFTGPILEYNPRLMLRHTLDDRNMMVTKFNALGNTLNFRDGSNFTVFRNMMFERLNDPFEIQGVTIDPGDYWFNDWNFRFMSSRARRVFGNAGYRVGGFYDGDKREISLGGGLRYNAYFQASVDWSRNVVDLPGGDFTTDLIGVRADAAFSPKMFLQALLQYNTASETVSTNIRYRFIHHPLSDFYVVYNEERGTEGDTETQRALSVKVTHLIGF